MAAAASKPYVHPWLVTGLVVLVILWWFGGAFYEWNTGKPGPSLLGTSNAGQQERIDRTAGRERLTPPVWVPQGTHVGSQAGYPPQARPPVYGRQQSQRGGQMKVKVGQERVKVGQERVKVGQQKVRVGCVAVSRTTGESFRIPC